MRLSQAVVVFITFLIVKDTKIMKNIREIKTNWIITSVIIFFLSVFLLSNYFNNSVNIDEFNVIEKVHEEKELYIYKILEEGEEKYLVLKKAGILNELFIEIKFPVQDMHIRKIDTFKYIHRIDIENSIITDTYKKRWGDGVVSYWIMSVIFVYHIREFEKASKFEKIIVASWLIITLGITIFFII